METRLESLQAMVSDIDRRVRVIERAMFVGMGALGVLNVLILMVAQ